MTWESGYYSSKAKCMNQPQPRAAVPLAVNLVSIFINAHDVHELRHVPAPACNLETAIHSMVMVVLALQVF